MKKLGIFIILILFCVVSYSQNNAVYKRVSLDTLKSRTGTKKMYLKDTVIINNIIRIPAGATDGNIAYSNANGDVIWGTLPSEADSLFVTYCCGCNMVDGWKALEDTIKIDTCYVNQIIKDSLSNHYTLIHDLDTGKVSTSGDIMYGGLNIKQGNLSVKGTFNVGNVPLGTDIDSVTVIENGQLKSVDGSSFKPDSTSSGCFNNFYYKQITGCNNNNLYIKADTTKFSNYIKLPKFANNTTEPVLKVLASGRIDTIQTKSLMGMYLDSLDVGDIDVNNISVVNTIYGDIVSTTSSSTVATNQTLLLPLLGSNYKPVLSVKDLSGTIDTTQVKSITGVDLDSLKITNYAVIGGVVTLDYEFTLADDGIYSFANSSYGFGNLYCFNAGKKTAFTQYSFDVDGVIALETSTPLVVNAELDGNEICLYYSGGTYYIKNTSGGSRNYILSIKYY